LAIQDLPHQASFELYVIRCVFLLIMSFPKFQLLYFPPTFSVAAKFNTYDYPLKNQLRNNSSLEILSDYDDDGAYSSSFFQSIFRFQTAYEILRARTLCTVSSIASSGMA